MTAAASLARNARCACGSGRRFKACCGALSLASDASLPARMAEALALQRAHRFEAAQALYEDLLASHPGLPDALHMLGVLALEGDDVARALALLREAAEAFGWSLPAVHHNLGLALVRAFANAAPDACLRQWLAYDAFRDQRRAGRRAFDGRVSVVVPSFGHADFVREALESLMDQTRTPDEVIVIDDGSRDASVDVITGVLRDAPPTWRLVARDNRGAAATLNEAVLASSGDYVGVLNSDDRFAPARIATMIDEVACLDAAWGFSRVEFIDGDGATIPQRTSAIADDLRYRIDDVAAADSVGLAFLGGNPAVSSGSLFFSRQLFDATGGFAPLRYNHDWDFCLRASLVAEPVFVPQATYDYRLHGANTILAARDAAHAEMDAMLRGFYRGVAGTTTSPNPFAPLPSRWGDRFHACVLAAGHAALLPRELLEDAVARAQTLLERR